MEPAVGRREHAWLEAYDQPPTILPQWSPPLDGGSTVVPEKQDVIGLVAAMEPACHPREHHTCPGCGPELPAAAMEPAAERREHVDAPVVLHPVNPAAMEPAAEQSQPITINTTTAPQWSPP